MTCSHRNCPRPKAARGASPANACLIAHFGMALANLAVAEKTDPDVARRALAEADYQTRRALNFASRNDKVKKIRQTLAEQDTKASSRKRWMPTSNTIGLRLTTP
jgi:hypothetical protein